MWNDCNEPFYYYYYESQCNTPLAVPSSAFVMDRDTGK